MSDNVRRFTAAEAVQYAKDHRRGAQRFVHANDFDGLKAMLRTAIGDYVSSEGCSCCQDKEAHDAALVALGEFLGVPAEDGWCNFRQFRTPKRGELPTILKDLPYDRWRDSNLRA